MVIFLLKCYLKSLLIRSLDLQCPIVHCTCKYVYGEGNDSGSDDHGDGNDDDDHNDDDDQTLKIHTDQWLTSPQGMENNHNFFYMFNSSSVDCRLLVLLNIMLCDWLISLTPLSQSQCKTKTNNVIIVAFSFVFSSI